MNDTPAFPRDAVMPTSITDSRGVHVTPFIPAQDGMTLRDYFAANAPPAPAWWHGGDDKTNDIVQWRFSYADSMLKERAK